MIAGIKNFKEVPNAEDPEHPHIKTALYIYSLDSFLFRRINSGSRAKDFSVVKTLGPYAVLITRIINNIERKRIDK